MAFDFPASPSIGATFNVGGITYVWDGVAWNATSVPSVKTAQTRNRIVNPAMQISQENGNTAGTTNVYFAADQWSGNFNTSGTMTVGRIAATTPNGSFNRMQIAVTVADASLTANEVLSFVTKIEGVNLVDFKYGYVGARQSVLRFGFMGPAGTYAISLRNSAVDRSYVAMFTITAGQANTPTEQTFVIPGDVTGTWLVDNSTGLIVQVTVASGPTVQGTTGWQAGNIHGTSAVSNGMATAGNVFHLFDVGLYLDPDLTGLAPPWEVPDYGEELARCKRYWQKREVYQFGYSGAGGSNVYRLYFDGEMRTAPTQAITTGPSYANASNLVLNGINVSCVTYVFSITVAGQASAIYTGSYNARM